MPELYIFVYVLGGEGSDIPAMPYKVAPTS